MSNDLTPNVLNVVEDFRLTPAGGVERRRRVTYMVGRWGPFSVTLAESDFTAARVMAEMEKTAVELRKLPVAS
jgi:hypothetical protein